MKLVFLLFTLTLWPSAAAAQTLEIEIEDKPVKMRQTGRGTDTHPFLRFEVPICDVTSWVDEKSKVTTGLELAKADEYKHIRIVMLRAFSGSQIGDGVLNVVRQNARGLDKELAELRTFLVARRVAKGDSWQVTHIKGKGLHVRQGDRQVFIASVALSRAFWDSYLGPLNAGDELAQALASRLSKGKGW